MATLGFAGGVRNLRRKSLLVAPGAATVTCTTARARSLARLNPGVSVARRDLALNALGPWKGQPWPLQVAVTLPPRGTPRTVRAFTPVVRAAWVNEPRSIAVTGSSTAKPSSAGVGSGVPAASSARTAKV